MSRIGLFLFALSMTLSVSPLSAQEAEQLEDWQKRILRALEEPQQGSEDGDETRDPERERQSYSRSSDSGEAAARAAEEAQRRYGGRPLASVRVGDAYRVRLLMDDGRVKTVKIAE